MKKIHCTVYLQKERCFKRVKTKKLQSNRKKERIEKKQERDRIKKGKELKKSTTEKRNEKIFQKLVPAAHI